MSLRFLLSLNQMVQYFKKTGGDVEPLSLIKVRRGTDARQSVDASLANFTSPDPQYLLLDYKDNQREFKASLN